MTTNTLILGVGVADLGDDGFGPLTLAELQRRYHWDPHVSAVDVRGLELRALPLLAAAHHLLVLSAARLGAAPGTLHRLHWSGTAADLGPRLPAIRSSGIELLRMLHFWLEPVPELTVIGVEPTRPAAQGMSPVVRAAVDFAVREAVGELRRWGHLVEPVSAPAAARPQFSSR